MLTNDNDILILYQYTTIFLEFNHEFVTKSELNLLL